MKELTLCLIKPDAVHRMQEINTILWQKYFKIIVRKPVVLTAGQACVFYSEHQDSSFFHPLVTFMSSGITLAQVLEGENAISEYRKLMGATDPLKAEEGTLRRIFGTGMPQNAVHGSANAEAAMREISFFFSHLEFLERADNS